MWVLFFLGWGLVAGKEFVGGGKEKREVFSFDGSLLLEMRGDLVVLLG